LTIVSDNEEEPSMTTQQPNLFSAPNVYGESLARSSDPPPSQHAAAQLLSSGRTNTQGAMILDILRRAARPLTYREIFGLATDEEKLSLAEANTVAKRLTTLSRRQLVRALEPRICSVGGSEARPWELVGP